MVLQNEANLKEEGSNHVRFGLLLFHCFIFDWVWLHTERLHFSLFVTDVG